MLAVAKGLEISKNVQLFGYKDRDLRLFDQENVEKLLVGNLVEKKFEMQVLLNSYIFDKNI